MLELEIAFWSLFWYIVAFDLTIQAENTQKLHCKMWFLEFVENFFDKLFKFKVILRFQYYNTVKELIIIKSIHDNFFIFFFIKKQSLVALLFWL